MSEINDISDSGGDDLIEKKDKKDKKDKPETTPIIRRVKKHKHQHHGGSWKIAYADFVTAMMAFFLLMWLVSSLNKAQKAGISEYFKQPMKLALFGGESLGNRQINIKGGGPNIEQTDGQVSATNKPLNTQKLATSKKIIESNKAEIKKLEELKSKINLSIEEDPALAGLKKQLRMDVVSDGLRIQLIDNQNKPMFDVGSDKINPAIEPILANIVKLLNSVPNKVTIQGHTDASPYHNPDELEYTNWELSAQRANAARRALIKAGMGEDKVMTVTGFSSTVLLDKSNPLNPENRRITIIVMKKGAEDKITTND
jgi:chemotaxis protein MotB